MKLTLTTINVKTHTSENNYSYTAKLSINKKNVGSLSGDNQGAFTFSGDIKEYERANYWLGALPPNTLHKGKCNEDIKSFCLHEVRFHLAKKEYIAKTKKKILSRKIGTSAIVETIYKGGGVIEDKHLYQFRRDNPYDMILNILPVDRAVEYYMIIYTHEN
ncbi:MAG: hypothetical protein ACJAS1_000547 [Oleiphilaceae bacterium]|jgi:hypothetical protein